MNKQQSSNEIQELANLGILNWDSDADDNN